MADDTLKTLTDDEAFALAKQIADLQRPIDQASRGKVGTFVRGLLGGDAPVQAFGTQAAPVKTERPKPQPPKMKSEGQPG